jgi:hypothetical protein
MSTPSAHHQDAPTAADPRDAALRSSLEFLSAAYAAMGTYSYEHPLVMTLCEATEAALHKLFSKKHTDPVSVEPRPAAFQSASGMIPRGHVSTLAGDLHKLDIVQLQLHRACSAKSLREALLAVADARHARAEPASLPDALARVTDNALRLVPLPLEAIQQRAALQGAPPKAGSDWLSETDLARLADQAAGDPAHLARRISDQIATGQTQAVDAVRRWLIGESAHLAAMPDAEQTQARQSWIADCVQRLTPQARQELLGAVPNPDARWFLDASRLAPFWNPEELAQILENITHDARSLRGTARLLFAQLWKLARQTDQRGRVLSLIEQWHAGQIHAGRTELPFAAIDHRHSAEDFRPEDYATELETLTDAGQTRRLPLVIEEIEDGANAVVRAADIAMALGESKDDLDRAAAMVARHTIAMIQAGRLDLITDLLASHDQATNGAASVRQRGLVAALHRPECIAALLDRLQASPDDTGVVRILDLIPDHAAPKVLAFCDTASRTEARTAATIWLNGLQPEVKAAAVGERLASDPAAGPVLTSLCAQLSAAVLGRHLQHLLESADSPSHQTAAFQAMSHASGPWPPAAVDALVRLTGAIALPKAVDALLAGDPAERQAALAEALRGLMLFRGAPAGTIAPITAALAAVPGAAPEQMLTSLLATVYAYGPLISKGYGDVLIPALRARGVLAKPAKRLLHSWRFLPARSLIALHRAKRSLLTRGARHAR